MIRNLKESLNNTIASMLEKLADNLKQGNSNLTYEEMDAITDMINRSTIKSAVVDRTSATNILNCSNNEFDRLKNKGLIVPYDDPNLVYKVYKVTELEALLKSGAVKQRKMEFKNRRSII